MAVDPVCQMEVDERTAQYTSQHDGQTFYFCAADCKRQFDKDPQKFSTAA